MPHGRRSLVVPAVAVCGVFLISGCALPPAIAIASYAATGISYLTSRKGPSDHALSAMVDMDCAMFRVVMGEDICHAQGDQPDDGVASDEGSGDYFDGRTLPQDSSLAQAEKPSLKGILLEGLVLGTEIFAPDPALVDTPENMRMILKVDDYAKNSTAIEGVRLNGKYYAISTSSFKPIHRPTGPARRAGLLSLLNRLVVWSRKDRG